MPAMVSSVISLGAGRYAIPVLGSASPAFKAWQPMLHARLAPHGKYYLGGLSALSEHRLTDLSEPTIFAVVGFWHSDLQAGRVAVAGRPVRLTRAQLETLAIVAYRQPITRPEIEDVRGVDSGSALKVLLERNVIKILGKKDEAGRPMLYGTSTEFLELFGLKSLRDLPTLKEFTELSAESRDIFERRIGEPLPGHGEGMDLQTHYEAAPQHEEVEGEEPGADGGEAQPEAAAGEGQPEEAADDEREEPAKGEAGSNDPGDDEAAEPDDRDEATEDGEPLREG
jgi:hypothetical protein